MDEQRQNMKTKELVSLADKIKKGMGKTILNDYKELKKSFKSLLEK